MHHSRYILRFDLKLYEYLETSLSANNNTIRTAYVLDRMENKSMDPPELCKHSLVSVIA